MTLLTEATDVFAAAETSGRCLVAFAAKRQPLASGVFGSDHAGRLNDLVQTLRDEGWLMSVRAMFKPNAPGEPYAFDTGFAHDADMVGAFDIGGARRHDSSRASRLGSPVRHGMAHRPQRILHRAWAWRANRPFLGFSSALGVERRLVRRDESGAPRL